MPTTSDSTTWLARQRKRAARSIARRLREYGQVEPLGFALDDVPQSDVALYFADGPPKLYQLTQWIPVFEANAEMRTVVVVRQVDAYVALRGKTSLKVILVPRYENLMALLDRANFRAVVYVNNSWTNFQALSFQRAVHIHVNHGESDKICMVSNQAKAYDKVFVAGEAAVERHKSALAWFDTSHLVRVGRPQLDLAVPPALPPSSRRTITYAPTWEGEDEANNYSSVDCYGTAIAQACLSQDARVIYKPHPRIPESDDAAIRRGHRAITELIESAQKSDPVAGHAVLVDADMLGVIASSDALVADVSSVTLDFLYLRPQAPILLTDRRSSRDELLAESPLAAATFIIDSSSVSNLIRDLPQVLGDDTFATARAAMRSHYFDNLAAGDSTERFWRELRAAMDEHDAALRDLSRFRSGVWEGA